MPVHSKIRAIVALGVAGLAVAAWSLMVEAQMGTYKKPDEFGSVVIDNYSSDNDMAPVVFQHWVHRARYTCRVCHVDLGFAMQTGATDIREEDVRAGDFCGACHNGEEAFAGGGEAAKKSCVRCHSHGKEVELETDFRALRRQLPRSPYGNKIDWIAAEEEGLITLRDSVPGYEVERPAFKSLEDSEIDARAVEVPDIIFSHEKHAVWNGCALCHPQPFAVKRGLTEYTMQDVFDGRFCGACHGTVAFPSWHCRLCHTKDV